MLDLQQLRYFVVVAECESIARAAERLHISQSPLSRQITSLESRFGLVLFARTGKRLKLTSTGQRYLGECIQLLRAAERLELKARADAAGIAGTLTLGYVEGAFHTGVLRQVLRKLQQAQPDAELQLQALRSTPQFEALRLGSIDIGFAHRPPPLGEGLQSQLVAAEPYLLAVPKGHPLASAEAASAQLLDGESFIFPSRLVLSEGHAQMLAACRRAGFEPDLRHEAAEPSVALELVASGLGMAIVQSGLRSRAPPGVRMLALPRTFALRLEIHVVASATPSPLAHRLLALLPRVGR